MKTLLERKLFNPCIDLNEPSTRSTLLIPSEHIELFIEKVSKNGGCVSLYLSYLLRRYRMMIRNGWLDRHPFLKTGYQKKYQRLRRIDFIPVADDWAELKCLRVFLNRSMTWIFVSLLLLDSLDLVEKLPEKFVEFVLPKISNVRLMANVLFSRKRRVFERFLQMTRDRAG